MTAGVDLSQAAHPQMPLRPPSQVMRLERMGSFFPTRLSFMRTLIRLLASQQANVTRPVWDLDDSGYGRAVYSLDLCGHTYSLVAFSTPLDPANRTDRVIAEAWDSSYVLFDGVPTKADLDRLEANAPTQEAGRYAPSDLTLSRANKSVRLFEHVVERLASGEQPEEELIGSIGYLMRTTAVYGNGKFGIADRSNFADRPGMAEPFRAEMITVWLIRGFHPRPGGTHRAASVARHVRAVGPTTQTASWGGQRHRAGNGAVSGQPPDPDQQLDDGQGNGALARVRFIETPSREAAQRVRDLIQRARQHVSEWSVEDQLQTARIDTLRNELAQSRRI